MARSSAQFSFSLWIALAQVSVAAVAGPASATEPKLPAGLETEIAEPQPPLGQEPASTEPQMPAGLEGSDEPELPQGLAAEAEEPPEEEAEEEEAQVPERAFGLTGFWEARGGARIRDDEHERPASVAESRLQLQIDKDVVGVSVAVTADLVVDALADRDAIDLETGEGFADLREASVSFSPAAMVDAKVGRQILTWGTGDLVFINDLFPKDWVSLLIGRDQAYLKAPSDAAKLSVFSDWANLDIVYTPRFNADRFIDGRRVSFFDPALGRIVGRDAILAADRPDDWFSEDEWAARLYRNISAYELAAYAYDGFWKSPAGSDPTTGRVTFPKLTAYGASLRGPVGKGIGNVEIGFYDSRQDRGGDDPFIRNSEMRLLLGYEQEIAKDLTLGVQYALEHLLEHDGYLGTLPAGVPARDENRHVLTGRLTWLTREQTVEWSLFGFISPSDQDMYLRPHATYKVTDQWTVEAGANLFFGSDDHTFFGQFRNNNNVYFALRSGF
jgi:hypothetical protein